MNIMKNPEQKKIFLISLCLAAVFGGLLLFLAVTRIPIPPCLFHRLTGLYCPGCGGTRAFIALLHGRFLQSLLYHPVVVYGMVLYFIYAARNLLALLPGQSDNRLCHGMAFRNAYLYGAVVLILLNWILKNILLCAFHLAM